MSAKFSECCNTDGRKRRSICSPFQFNITIATFFILFYYNSATLLKQFYLQCRLVSIELAQPYSQNLVVVLLIGKFSRQLYADIIGCKAMHSLATCRLLEEHFLFGADIACIEIDAFLLTKIEQTLASHLFSASSTT